MPLEPGARLGPYELLGLIGTGGMGKVYRARDTRLGRLVALKLLAEAATSTLPERDRLFREAQTLSQLNHPNIVTIHDIGEADGGLFIAMELVEGQTVRHLLRDRPAVERWVAIATQVTNALAAAHDLGIIHRDIKPENIMIRTDGYVKVLDFGLARTVSGTADGPTMTATVTSAGIIRGTVPYMSPEQLRDDVLSPASDIFSLGIVLYELATGTHPFTAGSAMSIASAILTDQALPAVRLNPELPDPLAAIVMEMLDKDPLRRPTATAVSAQLGAGAMGRNTASPPLAAHHITFVGRGPQLRELESGLEATIRGSGRVHAVSAGAGFGKTTLVNYFLARVSQAQQCGIVRGRCSERLAGTEAYVPLLEALEGMLRDSHADFVARTMRTLAPHWYAQLRPSAAASPPLTAGQGGSREQMKRQLYALFHELTRARPHVLFLDDVHWADPSTLDLIAYLCDRFDSLRLLVLMSFRPAEVAGTQSPFAELRSHLQIRGAYRETVVEGFTRLDVDKYVDRTFPGHGFPEGFLALLYSRTEGVPLFLADLLRQLVEQEIVNRVSAEWCLSRPLDDIQTDIPASVRALIKRTVDRLDEEDRRIVIAASVQGLEFDSAVVARALQLDAMEVEERIERAERAHGIVRLIEQRELRGRTPSMRYAFTHHYYHNAFHDALRGTRRQKLSAAVAAALQEYHGGSGAMAAQLAVLYQAANDVRQAAVQYLAAAQHAARVFAHKESVVLARRGLDMLAGVEESAERDRLELQLLTVLGIALTPLAGYAAPEVEAVYSRAREFCDRLGDSAERLGALYGIHRYYVLSGRLETACDLGQQLLDLASRDTDPLQLLLAHYTMVPSLIHLAAYDRALEHVSVVSSAYEPQYRPALRATYGTDVGLTCLLWEALVYWFLGRHDEATATIQRALALATADPVPVELGYVHCMTAWIAQCRGDRDQVREHAERAIHVARAHDLPMWLALGTMFRSWALAASGQTGEGIDGLQQGIEGFKRTGAHLNLPYYGALLADAHRLAGNTEPGLAAIEDALNYVGLRGDRLWEPELLRLRGEFLQQRGPDDLPAAEASFRAAIEVADAQRSPALSARATASLAKLLGRGSAAAGNRG